MNDTSTYKARLEEEKQKLEGEMETVGRKNPSVPNDWEADAVGVEQEADELDRASNLDAYQENTAVLADLEARYGEVNAALERIQNGSYGTCEVGAEEIETERLEADPAARTCIAHVNA